MKRLFSAASVLLLCLFGLSANPFLGTWEAEMIFLEDRLIFRFIDGETVSIQATNDEQGEFVGYLLNEQEAILDLGMLNGIEMKTRYEFRGEDTFILYFTESVREQMALDMAFGIPENANQLTRDFSEAFTDAVTRMLVTTAVLTGRRIR